MWVTDFIKDSIWLRRKSFAQNRDNTVFFFKIKTLRLHVMDCHATGMRVSNKVYIHLQYVILYAFNYGCIGPSQSNVSLFNRGFAICPESVYVHTDLFFVLFPNYLGPILLINIRNV